jgi:hypothetical protein
MQHLPNEVKRRARELRRSFGGGAAALGVAASIPSPLGGPFLVMASLMAALTWKANEIAEDPPRSDWYRPTHVRARRLRWPPSLGVAGEAEMDALVHDLLQIDACMSAGLRAYERALGAEQTLPPGDAMRAARATEAAEIFSRCAYALTKGGTHLRIAATFIPGEVRDQLVWRAPSRLRDYPPGATSFFFAVGMSEDDGFQLARFRHLEAPSSGPPTKTLSTTATHMSEFAGALGAWTGRSTYR